jgi:hypothetical protein
MKFSRGLYASLICLTFATIFSHAPGSAAGGPAAAVTFNKDVAPILQRSCMTCHRPGEVAPMSLLTYKEVRPWAKSIREVVQERRMPPWPADPRHGEFSNDRRLSQREIETITAWVEGGAREGDAKDLPPNPKFVEGWSIGQPDVILAMTEEYSVPADGVVPYKNFIVPTNFTEDRYVQAAEIRAGNRSVVHHVIVSVLAPTRGKLPSAGLLRQEEDLTSETTPGRAAVSGLVGTAPGMPPLMLPPGQAKLIKAGSALTFQMHYTPNGEATKDRTSVGLIFTKAPVQKLVQTGGAFGRNLAIPPGDPNHEVKSSYTFKEDAHLTGFMPHMHYRGKDFEYRAVFPDGTTRILLSVPRYDFNWQLHYKIKNPIAVPKGTRIDCTAHFDNSAANKYNPDPTKLVRWGPQTWEEMMIGWFDYTLDSQNLTSQTASR